MDSQVQPIRNLRGHLGRHYERVDTPFRIDEFEPDETFVVIIDSPACDFSRTAQIGGAGQLLIRPNEGLWAPLSPFRPRRAIFTFP